MVIAPTTRRPSKTAAYKHRETPQQRRNDQRSGLIPVSGGPSTDRFSKALYDGIIELSGLTTFVLIENPRLPGETSTAEGQPIQHHGGLYWEFELDREIYRALIETRGWTQPVDLGSVLRLRAVKVDLINAPQIVKVTLADFRKDAIEFARAHGIATCVLPPTCTDENGNGTNSVFLTVRRHVPKFEKLSVQLDKEWMSKQSSLLEGEAIKLLCTPARESRLYLEDGLSIATMEQLLKLLPPREAKPASNRPVRKRFGQGVYLRTGNADLSRVKLSGVEAVVSVVERERRYAGNGTVIQLRRAITGRKDYLVEAGVFGNTVRPCGGR